MQRASPGDLLVVGKTHANTLTVFIATAGSTFERQILWLFSVEKDDLLNSTARTLDAESSRALTLAARQILESIGIEPEQENDDWLDVMIKRFEAALPATRIFSAFARETLPHIKAQDNPDLALLAWMDQEELLFRAFEKHLVADRLIAGFGSSGNPDVDGFIEFSLSVQNRRKSRAGYALGNHVEAILKHLGIRHKREAKTEGKSSPDFLFPGEAEYHDPSFPETSLFMLGAKTSCKDRWRQVLAEAGRIKIKHLITLEPGISIPQTDEMKEKNLQLVVPKGIHETYLPIQHEWLMDFNEFLKLVR